MKEMKKLTRKEMKTVVGGTAGTIWSCVIGTGAPVNQCSHGDPTTRCFYTHCTNTGVVCVDDGFCD